MTSEEFKILLNADKETGHLEFKKDICKILFIFYEGMSQSQQLTDICKN